MSSKKELTKSAIAGVAGALIGAIGLAAWQNRETVKEKAVVAKEATIEFANKTKTSTVSLVKSAKDKYNNIQNKAQNTEEEAITKPVESLNEAVQTEAIEPVAVEEKNRA